MTLNAKRNISGCFDFQITHTHANRLITAEFIKRRTFTDLSMCTCHRLVADCRHIPTLYHHFYHLAHSLLYLHKLGVVHGDIKPNNVFVRVQEGSATDVTRVQLVLADFDLALLYRRDISYHDGEFKHNAQWGTTGYFPAEFSEYVSYEMVAYDKLSPEHRPKGRPLRSPAKEYVIHHPFAEPYLDIFALGMVFLGMFHRSHYVCTLVHLHQTTNEHVCSTSRSSLHASAHVLLCHRLTAVNPTIAVSMRAQFDLFTYLSHEGRRTVGVKKYNDIIEMRESKEIDDTMYELLEC